MQKIIRDVFVISILKMDMKSIVHKRILKKSLSKSMKKKDMMKKDLMKKHLLILISNAWVLGVRSKWSLRLLQLTRKKMTSITMKNF